MTHQDKDSEQAQIPDKEVPGVLLLALNRKGLCCCRKRKPLASRKLNACKGTCDTEKHFGLHWAFIAWP